MLQTLALLYFLKTIRGACLVDAGGYHTLMLKQNDVIWAKGWNDYGQWGDGLTKITAQYTETRASVFRRRAGSCCRQSTQHDTEAKWQHLNYILQRLRRAR